MDKKIYQITLNRASKLLDRLAVLRAEANSNVNMFVAGVKIEAATADTAQARLETISKDLQLNVEKTLGMIDLHNSIKNQIMIENAKHGITGLLANLEASTGKVKFLDHTITQLTARAVRSFSAGTSADTPKLDEVGPVLQKMIDYRTRVDDLVQNLPQGGDSDKVRLQAALSSMQYNHLMVLPVSTTQLKRLEEERAILRRSINSLHDQLSAANANKIDIELPVSVALDLGLSA